MHSPNAKRCCTCVDVNCCTKQPIKLCIYVVVLKTFQSIYWNHVEIETVWAKRGNILVWLKKKKFLSLSFFGFCSVDFECCKFKVIALVATCISLCPHINVCNWNWSWRWSHVADRICLAKQHGKRESQTRSYCRTKSIYFGSMQIFQINWLVDTFLLVIFSSWMNRAVGVAGTHTHTKQTVNWNTANRVRSSSPPSLTVARVYDLYQCDYDSDGK